MLSNGAFENKIFNLSSERLLSLKLIIAKSWSIEEASALINEVLPQPVLELLIIKKKLKLFK